MNRALDELFYKRELRRWRQAAKRVARVPLAELNRQQAAARRLRTQLDRLLCRAEERLAALGLDAMQPPLPHGTDWFWRPDPWRAPLGIAGLVASPAGTGFGSGITLFHDCPEPEFSLRQLRHHDGEGRAPFGLQLDIFGFNGTFLSLVVNLPESAARDLGRNHLVRIDTVIETEQPLRIFARLNIRHGPNIEQILQELPAEGAEKCTEFDLAYSRINEKRVEELWLDLIFESPAMNGIAIPDLTLSRHRRAAL